jgi:ATP-binding cassette subfamily B protein
MKLLLRYLAGYKGLVLLVLLLALIDQLFINLTPYIFGNHIIDPYANKVGYYRSHGLIRDFFRGIGFGVLEIVVVSTVAWIASTYKNYLVNIIIRKLGADLYADVQQHTLCLPYKEFEDQRSGEILSVLQRARLECENFITKFMNVFFVSIIKIGIVMVIAWPLSPVLPVFYFAGAVLLSVTTHLLTRKMKIVQKEIVADHNALSGSTTESLRNIELIKSLGLVAQEIVRLNAANKRILNKELVKIKSVRFITSLYGAFIQILHQAVIFILLVCLFYDKLTVGQLIMMQLYFYSMFGTLPELGGVIVSYRDVEASLNNLQSILVMPRETGPADPEHIGAIHSICVKEIAFRHRSAVYPVLDGVSFEIGLGETVAIAGPSGAGKTTVIKLLMGLYAPTEGRILYNGHDYHKIDIDEVRRQTGLVTQEAHLFSGTIRENLLFVNPAATDEMIIEALEQASCQRLLARSPKGLDTIIGEGGLKLSGGERQRLSIARSLLRNARLLIFDEATSSLDSLTEKGISDTIMRLTNRQRFITIMIAHRLSTIMFADRILVLDAGRIVETGTHSELIAQKGLYSAMWYQQTGGARDLVHHPVVEK